MEILTTVFYIILCVLLFSLAIVIHEFGHFIVAVKLGLRVERFSLGFGPAIWKRTFRGVEYRISCIPLGGYVSIPDVDPEGTKALEGGAGAADVGGVRGNVPAWKEVLVAFAGPAMNIVLAVVLAVVLACVPSVKFGEMAAVVNSVVDGTPAAQAGIRAGDRILSVGGHAVDSWSEMMTEVQISGGHETAFEILRDGGKLTLSFAAAQDPASEAYYIGTVGINETGAAQWMPARNPLRQLAWDAGSIFRVLKGLVTPKEMKATGKALGGPVMIAEGLYRQVRRDAWDGLGFLRFLNVNLAVLNLLPIPVLDGGLILFALFAMVFRRRVPEKVVSVLSMTFMVLLMGLMALLFWRDGRRSYRMHTWNQEAVEPQAAEDKGGR